MPLVTEWAGSGCPCQLLASLSPKGAPPCPPDTHSLQRLTMAVFFLAFRVLLADSEGGSSSHDRL